MRIDSASYPLAGIDVARGLDALVAYTDRAARTFTDHDGCEVVVMGGRVILAHDRQADRSAEGTPIPESGFVLSGQGTART